VILREASVDDWPRLAEFLLTTPVDSGTSFVLDRRPHFPALPELRGNFRSFFVLEGQRIAGTVTALWRQGWDGARWVTVGEVLDLRVAGWARGGRAAFQLLRAAHQVFAAEGVAWVVCLIGRHNAATLGLVGGRSRFPTLKPLEEFASVHFIAGHAPRMFTTKGVRIRAAAPSDAELLVQLIGTQLAAERFAPPNAIAWPDPAGTHRAWLAFEPDGVPCGALVTWDGEAYRRLRILRYRAADFPLRVAIRLAARFGMTNPLPAPGGVLGLWATRAVAVRRGGAHTLRALLNVALTDAAAAGRSVLQLNLPGRDPLLRHLPPYPRSTYWTTLFGGPFDRRPMPHEPFQGHYHADLARV
jgi:hypothetical protein